MSIVRNIILFLFKTLKIIFTILFVLILGIIGAALSILGLYYIPVITIISTILLCIKIGWVLAKENKQ